MTFFASGIQRRTKTIYICNSKECTRIFYIILNLYNLKKKMALHEKSYQKHNKYNRYFFPQNGLMETCAFLHLMRRNCVLFLQLVSILMKII